MKTLAGESKLSDNNIIKIIKNGEECARILRKVAVTWSPARVILLVGNLSRKRNENYKYLVIYIYYGSFHHITALFDNQIEKIYENW